MITGQSNFLLDTCSFLWFAWDSPKLAPTCKKIILDESNTVFLGAASVMEIAIKSNSGKLELPEPAKVLVPKIRETAGIQSLHITEETALLAGALPLIHPDPFDRLLIAQAISSNLTILTPDKTINQYPVRVFWD